MPSNLEITPDLQAVEDAIDEKYLENRLAQLTFSEAAWYFLAFCEEMEFKRLELDGINSQQELACHTDQTVNNMKIPLRWLLRSCQSGTQIPKGFCSQSYQASWDLTRLADEYATFESAYVYARAGAITLQLQDDTVIPQVPFRQDTRYEAYDRLFIDEEESSIGESAEEFFRSVAQTVTISGNRFKYRLNPQIVSLGMSAMSPLQNQFWLPATWKLPRYSFGDFRSVLSVVRVMAMIHHFARIVAARQGCIGMGYLDSVLLMGGDELSNRLQRYTGLDATIVNEVIHNATFGECGIRHPDPAIQPLIQLSSDRVAISPALFLAIDIERNFTILLNRLPEERKVYSQLSKDRESLSRQRIIGQLQSLQLRTWHGKISGRSDLPDLDLVLFDDIHCTCLILELKAFIAPAEPREILEKSEEIKEGVSQVKLLRDALFSEPTLFSQLLEIDDRYQITFAVASETFVGTPDVQDESVPVIRVRHLIRRLLAEKSLSAVCRWLQAREYLPIQGKHFEVKDVIAQVGEWKLQWYGIKPLITDDYL